MTELDPDWNHYRSFLSVLEHGSLSASARALGLTQPTLGRHIDELQKRLGLVLFTRSTSGLIPTAAALTLHPHAEALRSATAAIERAALGLGEGVRGVVRITASEVIGVEVLPPILTRLRQQHPDLQLELVLSNQLQNLLQRDADIAVRMVAPTQEALIARRIGQITLGLHAHQDYLQRMGTPASLSDITAPHVLIGFDTLTEYLRTLLSRHPQIDPKQFSFRCDSDVAQLAMIRAGFGIGFCQVGIARREPLLQRLVAGFEMQLETWVAMHENLRDNPACRLTFEALAAGLHRYISQTTP
ncbi:LysR family transcriptional regulator [Pokkaliibacter plantistimulans]|uniref:LysR family transcriptional regulator n=1 Tax=Proteobacteria bacterium 228 TaxID=2083153 RepID=A0A2S5KTH1_9PROT|nr:LysR family transcriptional regulator [Pokkaliibacter plantistimulans]PPC77566.1 LysR family transcriptional regulator [Pokkaliibacter plantistimulans]